MTANQLAISVGRTRWAIPTATVAAAILGALGAAYRVVAADREAALARIEAAEGRLVRLEQGQERQELLGTQIRADLGRIEARLAEVQVTLMRGGR